MAGPNERPTPTQEENDRAALGEHILERDEGPGPEPPPEPEPPPVNTAAPVVSGTAEVGSQLTTTNGAWSNAPTSFTHAWRRGGTTIGGAIGAAYTLVAADEGEMISSYVTATNPHGSASAASNPVGPVTAAPPPEDEPPGDGQPETAMRHSRRR
jgi:hypothetical protein